MADNVTVTPGTGVIIGTRDTGGGVEVQRVIPNTWNGATATDVSTTNPLPFTGTIKDGTTSSLATVAQFHNADNQSPGGTAYGLLTGGVAQLLNISGNLDRQRETGFDGVGPVGIASGAAQFAMAFLTTDATDNFAAGTRVFTPAAMSGAIGGVAWSIQLGAVLSIDSGANQEYVLVTAVTATTFTAVTTKAHNGTGTPFAVTGFVYNQERDAAGELDGATGAGTAVATEYEYNSGGPGNSNYDRARNLQGKGLNTATITSGGGAGSASVVLSSATGLQPGQPIYFAGSGTNLTNANSEVAYVARNYISGTTVPLASALVSTHANGVSVYWDAYVGPVGPGLNGFLPTGIGIEEAVVYDPVSGNYFVERAATQDGFSGQNVEVVGPGLFNGTTLDRQRGNLDNIALVASAAYTTTQTGADQTNYNHRGVIVTLNVTVAGTGSITLEVDYKDPLSGAYIALLTGAAVTTNTAVQYTVYPGVTAAANAAVSMALPRTWRVKVTANNVNTITYSVGASLIL